jgi:hypothetical protein
VIELHSSCMSKIVSPSFWKVKFLIILKGQITPCLRRKLQHFTFGQINSLPTVEIVMLLIWSSGLSSKVQLPVASAIAMTRT